MDICQSNFDKQSLSNQPVYSVLTVQSIGNQNIDTYTHKRDNNNILRLKSQMWAEKVTEYIIGDLKSVPK